MGIWFYLLGSVVLVGVSLLLPSSFGICALLLGCVGLGFVAGLLLHDWLQRPLD